MSALKASGVLAGGIQFGAVAAHDVELSREDYLREQDAWETGSMASTSILDSTPAAKRGAPDYFAKQRAAYMANGPRAETPGAYSDAGLYQVPSRMSQESESCVTAGRERVDPPRSLLRTQNWAMHARTGSTASVPSFDPVAPYHDPYGRRLSHQSSQPDLRTLPGQSRESLVAAYPPAPIDTRRRLDSYAMQPAPYGTAPSPYSTEPSPYSAAPPTAPLLYPQRPETPPDPRYYR